MSARRAEIQALRAAAVTAVVAYHLAPRWMPGGFCGVDAFFAISGFVITRSLLREASRGGLALGSFWERRARRLLPAAVLVLACSGAAAWLLYTTAGRRRSMREIQAASLGVENRRLAADLSDYWTDPTPSPVRHYWSLSVEEQFYLLWPLLLALALRRRTARGAADGKRAVGVAAGVASAASFAYGLHLRASLSPAAFYSTAARAWEFGAGACLAAADPRDRSSSPWRAAASWGGWGTLAYAALDASAASTPLSVAAALLVVWAGIPAEAWAATRLIEARPVQWLGELSYSVYLWHWPIIVLAPQILGRDLVLRDAAALVPLILLAAWLTKTLVEDPFRYGRLRPRTARLTFSLAAAAAIVTGGAAAWGLTSADAAAEASTRTARRLLAARPPCFGAAARDPAEPCRNPTLERLVIPPPGIPVPVPYPQRVVGLAGRLGVAEIGAETGPRTLALIGDSHAIRLTGALAAALAASRRRGLVVGGCAATMRPRVEECRLQNLQTLQWLRRHPEIDTVVVAQRNRPDLGFEAQRDGFAREWRTMPPSVRRIVVVRDNPRLSRPECLERAAVAGLDAARVCSEPRSQALQPDAAVSAARRLGTARYSVLDLSAIECDATRCFPIIGGARVYADSTHLTEVFASTLEPYLARELGRLERRTGLGAR